MTISCRLLDYTAPADAERLVSLLDGYARDPMGGGEPLPDHARATLAGVLAGLPQAFSIVAERHDRDGGTIGVGLANCVVGVSTFAATPLVNIHDLYVAAEVRGQGVGRGLLEAVRQEAIARGACKITLEVLSGNARAMRAYERFGFAPYRLDDASGSAEFWQLGL